MTLAERLSPRVEVELLGHRWRLLFTHSVLLDCEAATGLSILGGDLDPLALSAKVLRAVLHALLERAGAAHSPAEVGAALGISGLPRSRAAIVEAWIASMPEPEKAARSAGRRLKSWTEAWAIADQDLGLSAAAWLDMTPRMVRALARQRLENLRTWDWMAGRLNATFANWGAHPPAQPLTAQAFMLYPPPGEDEDDPDELIGDRIMRQTAQLKRQ